MPPFESEEQGEDDRPLLASVAINRPYFSNTCPPNEFLHTEERKSSRKVEEMRGGNESAKEEGGEKEEEELWPCLLVGDISTFHKNGV